MESLGAVQELCNVTDSLESKINYLERFNKKLAQLKRMGSIKSTVSSADSDLSRLTSVSTIRFVQTTLVFSSLLLYLYSTRVSTA